MHTIKNSKTNHIHVCVYGYSKSKTQQCQSASYRSPYNIYLLWSVNIWTTKRTYFCYKRFCPCSSIGGKKHEFFSTSQLHTCIPYIESYWLIPKHREQQKRKNAADPRWYKSNITACKIRAKRVFGVIKATHKGIIIIIIMELPEATIPLYSTQRWSCMTYFSVLDCGTHRPKESMSKQRGG